jgi:CopG family nickel-responsive transcriptional regulator
VKAFADHVIAERGVRDGHVMMMPIEPHAAHRHPHEHKGQRK